MLSLCFLIIEAQKKNKREVSKGASSGSKKMIGKGKKLVKRKRRGKGKGKGKGKKGSGISGMGKKGAAKRRRGFRQGTTGGDGKTNEEKYQCNDFPNLPEKVATIKKYKEIELRCAEGCLRIIKVSKEIHKIHLIFLFFIRQNIIVARKN